MEVIVQVLANAVLLSLLYVLTAMGLTMIYGVMRILNWAHGSFVMLGAFLVYYVFAKNDVHYVAGLIVAMIAMAALGIIVERLIFKPKRSAVLTAFIMSIGVLYILEVLAEMSFGSVSRFVPPMVPGSVTVAEALISVNRLVLIPIAAVLVIGYWLFLERSKWGRGIRATAQSSVGARLSGIRIDTMAVIAMASGTGMAGAAGALMAPTIGITPYIAVALSWKAFIIVFMGGRLSLLGTALAAGILGFTESFITAYWSGEWITMVEMALLAGVLLFRPGGLLGVEVRD